VYGYKDRGFVINRDKAMDIFGPEVLKSDSPEYEPANQKRDYPDKVNLGGLLPTPCPIDKDRDGDDGSQTARIAVSLWTVDDRIRHGSRV